MRSLRFAVAALCIAAVATPVAGQNSLSPGAEFVGAVRKSDGSAAAKLLDEHGGSIINARDYNDNTALIAAINNNADSWVGFLLSKGADPNLAGPRGETPLIAAARIGYEDAVDWLLSKGAKVDQTNRMGETPLIIAVQHRQARIAKQLLKVGANPDKTDGAAGLSARDYATRDTRSREILNLINAAKPKPAASR